MSELKILVPLDGSEQAEAALSFLPALKPMGDLRVRLLTVVESDRSVSPEEEARREALARQYLDGVTDRATERFGLPVECVYRTGSPYEEILEEARRDEVNLMVMTTQGRSATDPERLGSAVDRVVRGAACPVLLINPRAPVPPHFQRITVPVDGSLLAAEALPVARSLAGRLGSKVGWCAPSTCSLSTQTHWAASPRTSWSPARQRLRDIYPRRSRNSGRSRKLRPHC